MWAFSKTSDGAVGLKHITISRFFLWVLLFLVLSGLFVLSLSVGTLSLNLKEIFGVIQRALFLKSDLSPESWVVLELRLPRALMAVILGSSLAVAGVISQGLFRNPLADPVLIGVASGAAFSSVCVIVLGQTLLSGWAAFTGLYALPAAGFIGCLLVTLLIYRIATSNGHTQVATLLLAGVAINLLVGAGTALLTFIASDQELRDLTFWSMGSLARGGWAEISIMMVLVVLPMLLMFKAYRFLNAVLMGEDIAHHLGFAVQQHKRFLLVGMALIVGTAVAFAGIIGFLGLIVPHALRLLVGSDHRALLPLSALAGACLLLAADILARELLSPIELPIGLIMALLGSPVFIFLLIRQARAWQ